MPWSDAPAITVVLVVALPALVVVPLAQMLGDGAGAQHGLEPLLELVAVLLGLLVVSVSLHALEAQEQARANVLVVGFGVAAACNFLHGVLVHSGPVHMPPGSADMSLWLSSWARVAEALTLGLTATRLSAPGPARAWLAAAGGVTLVLAGSALGPLPHWFAHAADGALRQVVAVGLALALAACGEAPQPPATGGGGVPQVRVITVQAQRLPLTTELPMNRASGASTSQSPSSGSTDAAAWRSTG